MSHSHVPKPARRLVQATALLLLPLAALAQSTAKPGYLLDAQGGFVHSGTPGQCWHTSEWTPALAQPECDPVLQTAVAVKVAAPAPQPVYSPAPVPTPAPRAPAPAAVAAAPPPVVATLPKPEPVVAPLQVRTMRYAADTLFEFDSFRVSAAGKKVLDGAAINILSLQGEKVDVVGHADRIGSQAYNQRLSLQRAEAVRDYLATKGVLTQRMVTRGVGETNPVTKRAECASGSNAQVIACLQPDRRVDIDVQGTKSATP